MPQRTLVLPLSALTRYIVTTLRRCAWFVRLTLLCLCLALSLSSASPRSASKSARSHALSCDEVHTHTCTHTRALAGQPADMLGTFLTLTGLLMVLYVVVLTGKLCIEVKSTSKLAFISEEVQLSHHASATSLSHSNSPPQGTHVWLLPQLYSSALDVAFV